MPLFSGVDNILTYSDLRPVREIDYIGYSDREFLERLLLHSCRTIISVGEIADAGGNYSTLVSAGGNWDLAVVELDKLKPTISELSLRSLMSGWFAHENHDPIITEH